MASQDSNVMLLILHRLEPGCLGPDGADHVEQFCQLAEKAIQGLAPEVVPVAVGA